MKEELTQVLVDLRAALEARDLGRYTEILNTLENEDRQYMKNLMFSQVYGQ